MPPEDLVLQPGQTAVVQITKYLEYRITNTGWVLEIVSTQPVLIRPETATKVYIVSGGPAQEDEI